MGYKKNVGTMNFIGEEIVASYFSYGLILLRAAGGEFTSLLILLRVTSYFGCGPACRRHGYGPQAASF
jgi:hypothetical protein